MGKICFSIPNRMVKICKTQGLKKMSGEHTLYNLYFQVYTLHHIKIKLTSSKAT